MNTKRSAHLLQRISVPFTGIILGLLFIYSPWGQFWSRFNYDLLFYLNSQQEPPENVVIVSIDEQSLGVINQTWPWPRSIHAKLLDKLFSAGAKTIAFDVLFSEPQSEKEDQIFGEVIRRHDGVVLAYDRQIIREGDYDLEKQITPIPELLSEKTLTGLAKLPVENDGFIRYLEREEENELFSLVAVSHYLGKSLQEIYSTALPRSSVTAKWGIHYFGPSRTIPTVFYYQALNLETDLPKDFFKNKLVLIGLTTQGSASATERAPDHFPTPYTRWGHGYMAGVEIHANIIASILSHSTIQEIDDSWSIISGIFLGLFGGMLFTYVRPLLATMIILYCGPLLFFSVFILFYSLNIYFPVSNTIQPLIIAYLVSPLYHYAQGRKERAFIKEAFSRYVSAKVVNHLLRNPGHLKTGGERVTATVTFLDLVGFTTLSEKLPAEKLVEVLNRYLGYFSTVILEADGMIDKYMGDAVMAVWGVPVHQVDHAKRACTAMLEITSVRLNFIGN